MQADLRGRIALITGSASGIGRAIALKLAANGAVIAVNDIDNKGEETCEEIRRNAGKAEFYGADVGDLDSVQTMVATVERKTGPIDILVNNAGVNVAKERYPIHEYRDSDWRRILRIDLDGVFYCSRAVSAEMVKRQRGAIINISSVLGLVPIRLQSAYATAKAAIVNLTRSHALEAGRFGVRVNGIAPGSILTDLTRPLFYNPESKQLADSLLSHIPLGKPGDPDDVASAALYLASDDAKYITGHILVVDGGWTAGFVRDW